MPRTQRHDVHDHELQRQPPGLSRRGKGTKEDGIRARPLQRDVTIGGVRRKDGAREQRRNGVIENCYINEKTREKHERKRCRDQGERKKYATQCQGRALAAVEKAGRPFPRSVQHPRTCSWCGGAATGTARTRATAAPTRQKRAPNASRCAGPVPTGTLRAAATSANARAGHASASSSGGNTYAMPMRTMASATPRGSSECGAAPGRRRHQGGRRMWCAPGPQQRQRAHPTLTRAATKPKGGGERGAPPIDDGAKRQKRTRKRGCGAHSGGGDAKRQKRAWRALGRGRCQEAEANVARTGAAACREAEADAACARAVAAPTGAQKTHTGGGDGGRRGRTQVVAPSTDAYDVHTRASKPRGRCGCVAHTGISSVNEVCNAHTDGGDVDVELAGAARTAAQTCARECAAAKCPNIVGKEHWRVRRAHGAQRRRRSGGLDAKKERRKQKGKEEVGPHSSAATRAGAEQAERSQAVADAVRARVPRKNAYDTLDGGKDTGNNALDSPEANRHGGGGRGRAEIGRSAK
ncbi:hypothetical protein C8R47DRAFT_1067777 [Mycena vitilis]|nr:hypothetical protein C8R47DRAFT_1067777 [Mycena vitilis]